MSVSCNMFFISACVLLGIAYGQAQQCNKPGIPSPQSECCGRDYIDTEKIIGGKETELGQFPWTVLVRPNFTNGTTKITSSCGGALITNRYVLTAAHCVAQDHFRIYSIEVHLAEYDKRTFPQDCVWRTSEGQRCITNMVVFAESVTKHTQYDSEQLQNDIALIRLADPVPYTESIRPICLPSADIDSPQFTKYNLIVAGWGQDGMNDSDVKQSTNVHLMPQNSCKMFYPELTRRHLCAGSLTGKDTCQGDSGGPLMMVFEGKHYVVGIVSGKRSDSPCGGAIPSLYTNVFQYIDWIKSIVTTKQIQKNLLRDCNRYQGL